MTFRFQFFPIPIHLSKVENLNVELIRATRVNIQPPFNTADFFPFSIHSPCTNIINITPAQRERREIICSVKIGEREGEEGGGGGRGGGRRRI